MTTKTPTLLDEKITVVKKKQFTAGQIEKTLQEAGLYMLWSTIKS